MLYDVSAVRIESSESALLSSGTYTLQEAENLVLLALSDAVGKKSCIKAHVAIELTPEGALTATDEITTQLNLLTETGGMNSISESLSLMAKFYASVLAGTATNNGMPQDEVEKRACFYGGIKLDNSVITRNKATIGQADSIYREKVSEAETVARETKAKQDDAILDEYERFQNSINVPEDAKAYIIARRYIYDEAASDPTIGEFYYEPAESILLDWSKQTHRGFPELRRACKLHEKTAFLSSEGLESREFRVGGKAYLLVDKLDTQERWEVVKIPLYGINHNFPISEMTEKFKTRK
ncbi:hypothetical protein [Vibrio mediterranei]|uniref:hypothetical protein n=1 Tax=Vibrio mediterranei TaxID=689 RepID=UPI0040683636